MPGSSAERTRKYIERLKLNGKYDEVKRKKAECEKSRRQRVKDSLNKMTESKRKLFVDIARLKCLERVRKFRAKAKLQSREPEKTSSTNFDLPKVSIVQQNQSISQQERKFYNSDWALAKAHTKLRKGLPKSTGKQKEVIAKFFNSLPEDLRLEIISNKTNVKKCGKKGVAQELHHKVAEFYERDDVSRISPNTKDARFYRDPTTGEKQMKQKRYMITTLEQAYDKFLIVNAADYPAKTPIKRSKFCALRPPHVLLVNSTPKNVCLCIYHENFVQCCAVLHQHLALFPLYGPEFKRLVTCNDESKDCWLKNCMRCRPEIVERKLRSLMKGKEKKLVKWWQWEKDETTNRTEKKHKSGTTKKLMEHLIGNYRAFLIHSFTNRQQKDSFNDDLNNVHLHNDECLIQIDFAENWTNESQDEVSSAHWNQKQVSLFTVSIRYSAEQHSKVIASDNLDHSKDTIFAYMFKILSEIPKQIKRIKIWSDGPSSQFKNKYMAAAVKAFEKKFRKKIFWNYHATAHGKSCVDGIGAVAKSKIKRMVNSRKSVVNSAKEFVNSFGSEPSKVEVVEMTPAEIKKINTAMKFNEIIDSAANIKDISKFHQIQCVDGEIKGFQFTKDGYNSSNL